MVIQQGSPALRLNLGGILLHEHYDKDLCGARGGRRGLRDGKCTVYLDFWV